jgi:hypothetical protein
MGSPHRCLARASQPAVRSGTREFAARGLSYGTVSLARCGHEGVLTQASPLLGWTGRAGRGEPSRPRRWRRRPAAARPPTPTPAASCSGSASAHARASRAPGTATRRSPPCAATSTPLRRGLPPVPPAEDQVFAALAEDARALPERTRGASVPPSEHAAMAREVRREGALLAPGGRLSSERPGGARARTRDTWAIPRARTPPQPPAPRCARTSSGGGGDRLVDAIVAWGGSTRSATGCRPTGRGRRPRARAGDRRDPLDELRRLAPAHRRALAAVKDRASCPRSP